MLYHLLPGLSAPVSVLALSWRRCQRPPGRAADDEDRSVLEAALLAGVNLFVTPAGGDELSELALRRVMRDAEPRPMVATKVHVRPGRFADMAADIRRGVDRSRRRLGRDVIDAVFLHNRIGRERDPRTDVLDVDDILVPGGIADALTDMVDAGTVGAVGVTALGHTDAILEVIESKRFGLALAYCNMLNPSATTPAHAAWRAQDYGELANRAAALGMGVIGLRALAGGALVGPGRAAAVTAPLADVAARELDADRVKARSFDVLVDDPAQLSRLAFRFALSQPALKAVLVGVSSQPQLDDVLAAVTEGPLDHSTIEAVNDRSYGLFQTA